MSISVTVTDLRFTQASEAAARGGLIGFLRFTLNGVVVVDGVTLRRTREGHKTLSFPVRHDARGAQHPIIRPIDEAARLAIEAQVFAALNLKQETAP